MFNFSVYHREKEYFLKCSQLFLSSLRAMKSMINKNQIVCNRYTIVSIAVSELTSSSSEHAQSSILICSIAAVSLPITQ